MFDKADYDRVPNYIFYKFYNMNNAECFGNCMSLKK